METMVQNRLRGFTLMELLIALAMFSAISGILMSSFFQFHRQSERMETILHLRQEIRVLEQIIRNDVRSVIFLNQFLVDPKNEKDGRKSGIYGIDETSGDHSLDQIHMHVNNRSRFYRNLFAEEDPEIHEVSYYLEEVETGKYEFKRREEFYIDPVISEGDRSIVHTLSKKIVSFDVKYFKGTEVEPLEEWDSSTYLTTKNKADIIPAGVMITLKIESKNGEALTSEMQINLQPFMGNFINWENAP